MPVKYWSFAGLMLTYECEARCASCYVCGAPGRPGRMGVDEALAAWRGLIDACPHGCRVHLTGGEPFSDWPALIRLCRRAAELGLAPLQKVETNAAWAADEPLVRDRLCALDEAGMGMLAISADPYHQQFIPIERARLAARIATDVLGADRVRVRWADWLADGFDTCGMDDSQRAALFVHYAAAGRDRLSGRAAHMLAPHLPLRAAEAFAESTCREPLLRSRHVHVDPRGRIMPGTCAGIVLGRLGRDTVADLWRRLDADHADRPVVGTLARAGPVGLMRLARRAGFRAAAGYAEKCHLCWDVRRFFVSGGMHHDELGPAWLYQDGTDRS